MQNIANRTDYFPFMAVKRPRVRETLARNLRALMRERDWSQADLAAKSGVSQRMISSILNQQHSCSTETADALARPFGLDGWELQMDMPVELLLKSPTLGELVLKLTAASAEARGWLNTFLDRDRKPPAD